MTKGIRKDAWESRPTSNKETQVMQRYIAIAALSYKWFWQDFTSPISALRFAGYYRHE